MLRLTFGTAKTWAWDAYIERNVCDRGFRIFAGPLRIGAFADYKPNVTEAAVSEITDALTRR